MTGNNSTGGGPTLPPEDLDRLWQYRVLQETGFYERIHLFLVAESMLLVAFAELRANSSGSSTITLAILVLGAVLTVFWWLANRRQMKIFDHARDYVARHWPEYEKLTANQPRAIISGRQLMAHSIPLLMLTIWLTLIGYTFSPDVVTHTSIAYGAPAASVLVLLPAFRLRRPRGG